MKQLKAVTNSPKLEYELSLVIGLFFRDEEWGVNTGEAAYTLTVTVSPETAVVTLDADERLYAETIEVPEKRYIKRAVYRALSEIAEASSPWGTLTGIRPVKIVHEAFDRGMDAQAVRRLLTEVYLIEPEKIDLMMAVASRERPHLYPIDERQVSLYISIPFCPTRCVYCSFPSNPLAQKGHLVDPYLDKLMAEITYAVEVVAASGKWIDCVYIGGGTPTALDALQLERLLKHLTSALDFKAVKEFTVEAGRPDSITREKLVVMKRYGVQRICVNPQTMHDATLKAIGRRHNKADVDTVMTWVREIGFDCVNMDLIVGLEDEGPEAFAYTMDEVLKWSPENVTVHTLSLKRASTLSLEREKAVFEEDKRIEAMLKLGDAALKSVGITPYYMYRQKKMRSHMENVGYAKKGHASLYNMRIMEEKHTILALGAGAVSKICYPKENRHERVANFKGVEAYLERFDEILKRKDKIRGY